MTNPQSNTPGVVNQPTPNYPLKDTAAMLNKRLGLYLSEEQQRGFAAALFIGTVVVSALLTWNFGLMVRRRT
jgi:hypothetical protein